MLHPDGDRERKQHERGIGPQTGKNGNQTIDTVIPTMY